METEFAGPPLPPQFGQTYSSEAPSEGISEKESEMFIQKPRFKKHLDKRKHKSQAKYVTSSSSEEESEVSVEVKKSSEPKRDSSEPNKSKLDPDPMFYREVGMSDLPSQYTVDIETFSNRVTEAPEFISNLTQRDEGVETPPPNDSLASLIPSIGCCLHSFRRDWQTAKYSNNVLNIITNGYILLFITKPKLTSIPLIQSGFKAHQKI